MKLNNKQIADYFHRSFTAVDGLWFMKVEEKLGFEGALEIDRAVWEVFPRIQAHEMKNLLKLERNSKGLQAAITTALELKGFAFKAESLHDGFKIIIAQCPWHETMVKSGRQNLSARIGDIICPTEYTVWAAEFGNTLHFSFSSPNRICNGAQICILCFSS